MVQVAVRAGRDALDMEAVMHGFEERSFSLIDAALEPASTRMLESFVEVETEILGALADSGSFAAKAANRAGSLRAAKLGLFFNRTNPEAVKYAKQRSAQLVTNISERARRSIRRIMGDAFENHMPPAQAARLLRDIVGLTEDHAEAVASLREAIASSPGRIVTYGKTRIRVPAMGATQDYINKHAERYAAKLLRYRTENIARTETIAASNEGQRQLWLQAESAGLIEADDKRVWIATPKSVRTCQICRAMHGQVVGLREPFTLPDGTKVMNPGAHPSCRCATGLAIASDDVVRAAALRALSLFVLYNPCHDKDGQFCKSSGGTGGGPSSGDDDDEIDENDPFGDAGFPGDEVVRDRSTNDEDMIDQLNDEADEFFSEQEDGELSRVISEYVQDPSDLNRALRDNPKKFERLMNNDTPEQHKGVTRDALKLQEAIEMGPDLPEGLIVWRGAVLSDKKLERINQGKNIKLAGFQSTSIHPDTATGFGGYLLEIKPKKGLMINSAEGEVLLPHGARFRVIGRKKVPVMADPGRFGNPRRTEMDVIQLEQLD